MKKKKRYDYPMAKWMLPYEDILYPVLRKIEVSLKHFEPDQKAASEAAVQFGARICIELLEQLKKEALLLEPGKEQNTEFDMDFYLKKQREQIKEKTFLSN